jgi:signal transduction histidine kinase
VAVSCVVAVLVLTASGGSDRPVGRFVLHLAIVGAPVLTGLYAVRTQHYERFGRMLIVAGFIWSLAVLAEAPSSAPYTAGRLVAWTIFPLIVYLMLAFPGGHLVDKRDRLLVVAITVVIATLYIGAAPFTETFPENNPWASCEAACPANAVFVLGEEPGFVETVLEPVRDTASVLLLLGVVVSLALRLRSSGGMQRVTIVPVLVVSIVTTLVLLAFITARRAAPAGEAVEALGLAWTLCLPAISAAFTIGLVSRRLLLADVVSDLSLRLRGTPAPREVRDAIGAAVGDASVHVLIHDREQGRWLDEHGGVAAYADLAGPGRTVRRLDDGSGAVAAIVLDDDGAADDELVDAIVYVAEAAMRQASLRDDLDVSLRDLDESRKRIATAADVERRRIERDLHDGAQQRLIALRMRLSLAEDLLGEDPQAASVAIHALGGDIDLALDEIRSLARGIYPAILADRGLADALRSVARRAPLRVEVRAVGLTRQRPEIESAVYFTCLEAMQNAFKHAGGATRVSVSLRQDHVLELWVADDGQGFAPGARAGRGLRNMHDRIESLGGTLEITTSRTGGTGLRAVLPLPSDDGDAPL